MVSASRLSVLDDRSPWSGFGSLGGQLLEGLRQLHETRHSPIAELSCGFRQQATNSGSWLGVPGVQYLCVRVDLIPRWPVQRRFPSWNGRLAEAELYCQFALAKTGAHTQAAHSPDTIAVGLK